MKEPELVDGDAETPQAAGPGMEISDIYYTLFRHKWKIILCSLTGVVVATVLYLKREIVYASEAKLMVRYVLETRALGPTDGDSQVKTPDSSGNALLNTELEMLSSFDLATNVAHAVGPSNILGELGPGDPTIVAAAAIQKGLNASVSGRSAIISVSYQHPDPVVARTVVAQAVESYLRMHARFHRGSDSLDDLRRQVDQQRSTLEQTEERLRQLKRELGVVSPEDSKKSYLEHLFALRRDILATEAELAELDAASGRPAVADTGGSNPSPTPSPAPPDDKLAAHRNLLARIEVLTRRELELSLQFTPESPLMRPIREQIEASRAEQARLEAETPSLTNAQSALARAARFERGTTSNSSSDASADLAHRVLRIDSLKTKLKVLNEQFERVRGEILKLDEKEAEITQLEREKQDQDKRYAYSTARLERARMDQALGPDNMPNIKVIQAASPAQRVAGKTKKLAGGAVAGGIGLGFGLAFLLELFVDQSLRRPAQVERHLGLPVFATIPSLRLPPTRRGRNPAAANRPKALPEARVTETITTAPDPIPRTGAQEDLKLYMDSLRDRLILHFQHQGLVHKPKLIGVTACGQGAGVTTVAAELACSLSETGDGNVLYVHVNPATTPSAHPFYRGHQVLGIQDALADETRTPGRVQDHLYVARIGDTSGRKLGIIPKALAGLIPRLKASDYDYIVFDLPPITQTSITSKIVGLMDMTFMVVESEKTHRDLAKSALALANGGSDEIAIVLNKNRQYLPARLNTDA